MSSNHPTLELVHVGGSRKTLEVLGCDAGSYPRLLLHWPTAGMYVLDIPTNVLRQCDCVMNRRKALPWHAADRDLAYQMWKEYRREKDAILRPLIKGRTTHHG